MTQQSTPARKIHAVSLPRTLGFAIPQAEGLDEAI